MVREDCFAFFEYQSRFREDNPVGFLSLPGLKVGYCCATRFSTSTAVYPTFRQPG